MDKGSLKKTGSVTFVKSLPIADLINDQTASVGFGLSGSRGSCTRNRAKHDEWHTWVSYTNRFNLIH